MPLSLSNRVRRRVAGTALLGALAITAGAWPTTALAKNGDVVATTASGLNVFETRETRDTCTSPELVQAFSAFGDTRDYVLAPGGSFEDDDLDGWQVNKARTTQDGSPLQLPVADSRGYRYGDDNEQSLKISAGGSATSPAMCVDLHYPTLRLMTKLRKGTGAIQVEVLYPDSDNPVFHPVGSLTAGRSNRWEASADVSVFPERGGAAPGMLRVALRFTSVAGNGEWRIDDLYVDPRRL